MSATFSFGEDTMNYRTLLLTLAVALAWSGCDDGEDPIDAGPDAGPRTDAGPGDAGPPPEDAGPGDDAGTDAGPMVDAGSDAGTDAGPTAITPSAAGDLVITEIQAAPVGFADDGLAEWLEVHNPSTTVTYNLNGCIISDNTTADDHTIPTDVLVAPGAYITLVSAAATVGFTGDYSWEGAVGGFSGGGDGPNIKCGGVVIDLVMYSAAGGYPDLVALEGHTLSLDPDFLDATANDTGANWCYGEGVYHTEAGMDNFGTPGAANPQCP